MGRIFEVTGGWVGGGVIFARETIFQGDGVPIESKVRLSAGASPFY